MRLGHGGLAAVVGGLLAVVLAAPANASPATAEVVGWGRNTAGQAGDNTWINRSTPVRTCAVGATDCNANPLASVSAVKGGKIHSLALRTDGSVLSWGDNFDGQLGDGTTTHRYRPVRVCAVGATDCTANPLTGVTAIAAGEDHNLALLADGTVVSWGNNYYGRLGDGTWDDRTTPVRVCAVGATDCNANPLSGVVAISAGELHSLALLSDGSVVAWGAGWFGALGYGGSASKTSPVRVCAVGATDCDASPLAGVTAIAAGGQYSLAVLGNGEMAGWGWNGSGQLGDGTTTERFAPVQVCASDATDCAANPLTGVTSVAAAAQGAHNFVLLGSGELLSWGFSGNGELGNGTNTSRSTPGAVCAVGATDCAANPLTGVTSIAAGGQTGGALVQGGTMLAWGGNGDGQLGDGTTVRRSTPGPVCAVGATDCAASPLSGVTTIGGGWYHFVAVRAGS